MVIFKLTPNEIIINVSFAFNKSFFKISDNFSVFHILNHPIKKYSFHNCDYYHKQNNHKTCHHCQVLVVLLSMNKFLFIFLVIHLYHA